MKKIDLHTHTKASDGQLTPTELIERAIVNNIDVLAITDHDSIAGLEEAHLANNNRLQLINGIEISCKWENYDVHIVGLHIDTDNPILHNFIKNQSQLRAERAKNIGQKLDKVKIHDAYLGAKQYTNGEVTRSHFARWLYENNYIRSQSDAFKKYLGKGKSCYVSSNWPKIEETISTIHEAGGVAILAHPTAYKLSMKWIKRLFFDFKNAGGDGVEVSWCQQSSVDKNTILQLATEYSLKHSVGSDFHGVSNWSDIGKKLAMSDEFNWLTEK